MRPIDTRPSQWTEMQHQEMPMVLVHKWEDIPVGLLRRKYPKLLCQAWAFENRLPDLDPWREVSFPGQGDVTPKQSLSP